MGWNIAAVPALVCRLLLWVMVIFSSNFHVWKWIEAIKNCALIELDWIVVDRVDPIRWESLDCTDSIVHLFPWLDRPEWALAHTSVGKVRQAVRLFLMRPGGVWLKAKVSKVAQRPVPATVCVWTVVEREQAFLSIIFMKKVSVGRQFCHFNGCCKS